MVFVSGCIPGSEKLLTAATGELFLWTLDGKVFHFNPCVLLVVLITTDEVDSCDLRVQVLAGTVGDHQRSPRAI